MYFHWREHDFEYHEFMFCSPFHALSYKSSAAGNWTIQHFFSMNVHNVLSIVKQGWFAIFVNTNPCTCNIVFLSDGITPIPCYLYPWDRGFSIPGGPGVVPGKQDAEKKACARNGRSTGCGAYFSSLQGARALSGVYFSNLEAFALHPNTLST